MVGATPGGLRALDSVRHKTYFGTIGQRQCRGKSRRTGKPCGQVAMRGKETCRHHGGKSRGRGQRTPMEQRSARQQQNYYIREARRHAKTEIENRELHPETMTVFRDQYSAKIYPSDIPRFLLVLDSYLKGEIGLEAWKRILEDFRALP